MTLNIEERLDEILTAYAQNSTVSGISVGKHSSEAKQSILALIDEARVEVLEATQRDFVHGESSEAFDEGRTYEQFLNKQLIAKLTKSETPQGETE